MSPPNEEQESCSCGPTHSEFAGPVEGGAPRGARSGLVFVGSCRNQACHTRPWWRKRSLDLALGSGGLESELMVPLGAGTEGSGSVELLDGGVAETPARSEESSGTGRRADDPARQSAGWSSWLPRVL